MVVKKIRVTNFKSFKKSSIELGKLNVLIGANASGKSNFLEIFKFLRDVTTSGLDNAISLQGGVEYLRNMNIGPHENFSVTIVSDAPREGLAFLQDTEKGIIGAIPYEATYDLAMEFNRSRLGFKIVRDRLVQKINFVRFVQEKKTKRLKQKEKVGSGEVIVFRVNDRIEIDLKGAEGMPIEKDDIVPPFLTKEKVPPNTLILERPFFFTPPLKEIFKGISVYDFDPKLPKKLTQITGKAELEEDGANLSIVLKNIIGQRDRKRKLFNLVQDLLPFVDDLSVEKFADKSLMFKLRETYFKRQYVPASLISDGTVNVTALIIALYFEKKPLTVVEEPGRNIHPHLISKVIDMMKDASEKKQIIVTTHNPEIVKYAGLENILLVSRDKEGFSTISRPADKVELRTFLKNEIGIEELYVQGLTEL